MDFVPDLLQCDDCGRPSGGSERHAQYAQLTARENPGETLAGEIGHTVQIPMSAEETVRKCIIGSF